MNNEETGTTECGSDEVPPVEVIPIKITADILDQIKRQIAEQRPDLKDEVIPIPVNVFIALPGNRVISASSTDQQTFVPGPDDKFVPRSLVPIALFVGVGSHTSGSTVGSKTEYIRWD